jgi:hypothetical protein
MSTLGFLLFRLFELFFLSLSLEPSFDFFYDLEVSSVDLSFLLLLERKLLPLALERKLLSPLPLLLKLLSLEPLFF